MIRFLLRALGFVLLAAAFASLVVDGARSIAGGRLLPYGLGDTIAWLDGPSYGAALRAAAAWPAPAQRLLAGLLAVPGWLAAGALGLALLHAGRPAEARPGFPDRRS